MNTKRPYVLTIAGYDPSAGAGVLADIKTFELNCVYGLAVITANTFQNDTEFTGLEWIPVKAIIQQLNLLFSRYSIDFVKIGLVQNKDVLKEIINYLLSVKPNIFIVWDPIVRTSSGYIFHDKNQFDIPFITTNLQLITPNWEEFKILFPAGIEEFKKNQNKCSLLIKGGHRPDKTGTDLLLQNGSEHELYGDSWNGKTKHGTGCVLSATITANIAKGEPLFQACKNAKTYVEHFIQSNHSNLGFHFLGNDGEKTFTVQKT